jgi:hypothetical protein
MKTTKFFSVLSLVLIFAAANTVYADNNKPDKFKKASQTTIKYQVAIHLSLGISTCNTYYVQITDETGRLVAPAQIFVPGVNKYVFNEAISVQGRARIASLVLPSNFDPYACLNNLITRPDVKVGPFFFGLTYSFDLFPLIQKGPMKE